MRAVIQRVSRASVRIDSSPVGEVGAGLLILLAVHQDDKEDMIYKLADKIISLRIFADSRGKMNLSLKEGGGEVMIVSQFTLYADTKKGNRPSFIASARPGQAEPIYDKFIDYIKSQGLTARSGEFGAMMEVESVNDGPVTIIIDS